MPRRCHLHVGDHRAAQGCGAVPGGDRGRPRRARAGLAWTAEDTLVQGLPLFHVHGLILGVLGSLRVGSRLVHTGRPHSDRVCRRRRHALLRGAHRVVPGRRGPRRRGRAPSGATAGVGQRRPAGRRSSTRSSRVTGHAPVERYGMTETMITVSSRADGERRPGQVGLPLPGVRTRVVGEDGALLPSDCSSPGELQVQAPTMFDGYLNRAQDTAACWTADGWFRTGDVAALGPDGWHRILGRATTDLIKSGGYRIGAGEIEAALLTHPAVTQAAVVGEPDAELGQRIVGYVVADGVSEDTLIGWVAEQLSAHKRPRRIAFLPDLPRNALGKVQKKELLT